MKTDAPKMTERHPGLQTILNSLFGQKDKATNRNFA